MRRETFWREEPVRTNLECAFSEWTKGRHVMTCVECARRSTIAFRPVISLMENQVLDTGVGKCAQRSVGRKTFNVANQGNIGRRPKAAVSVDHPIPGERRVVGKPAFVQSELKAFLPG